MTADQMLTDEMDEPHPYRQYLAHSQFNFGKLDEWKGFDKMLDASSPQLVNEYAWIWLLRNGKPSKLTVNNYNYILGDNATAEQRREMHAYWLQLETEWLRSERSLAGVLAFCHLTNNYGFTGDWFIDNIKDLKPAPVFGWFRHCFNPSGVFINLTDERYTKHTTPHAPGSQLVFNLIGVNDNPVDVSGKTTVKLYDANGAVQYSNTVDAAINAYGKVSIPYLMTLPAAEGGYLLTAEYLETGAQSPVISRRYIKIGNQNTVYKFHNIKF
ncbi:hypothetical protein FACS189464_0340 [Bacteroidia bacterium]|nr:hypothetical protein FACS189464_0340 [Bacteroidia bacterium]